MAKKLGKIVLFTAAVAAVASAVYYFMHKREKAKNPSGGKDNDNLSDESDKTDSSRNYVPLNAETADKDSAGTEETDGAESAFTPLAEQIAQAAGTAEENVEEFFDDEDSSPEEPPVSKSANE